MLSMNKNTHFSEIYTLLQIVNGFPQALENLENHKKSSMHGKIMEFEKNWIIMEKLLNFVTEPQVARKTSCQTHKFCVSDSYFSGYWWFQALVILKCMHGLQACLFKYISVAAFRIYA